jgi:hypothetical protein
MASKFWTGGSSSDEESEHSSDEEVKVPSRFAAAAESESSDEDDEVEVKRVVKSARDKRFEEFAQILAKIKNSMKINDWNNILEGKNGDLIGWFLTYSQILIDSTNNLIRPNKSFKKKEFLVFTSVVWC